jgi:hypothetical protein
MSIKNRDSCPALDQAVAEWRAAARSTEMNRMGEDQESFSGGVRQAILRRAAAPADPGFRALDSLFVPFRTLAAAGALPVIALSLFLGSLVFQGGSGPVEPVGGTLTAMKVGDRVVFSIANGDRDHEVLRGTRPEFDRAAHFTTTRGEFSDRLDGDASLVFYRID